MHMKAGYRQTEAGSIPADWGDEKLGNFISLQRGHDLTWRDRRQGDVPVMGSAGQNGFHDTAIAKGPGLVLGRSGASFGQAHYCQQDFWPHNTALYVTDFRGNDPLFVFYFLSQIDFTRHNSGGAQQSLNRNFIAHIPIGVPQPVEQRAIAGALSDVDALLGGIDRLIARACH
jgi:type I restriction enzyme, S subunit